MEGEKMVDFNEMVCGNCKYSQYDYDGSGVRRNGGYYCSNESSVNCGVPTFYDDSCEEFEEKEEW